jgi:hypothetical protein
MPLSLTLGGIGPDSLFFEDDDVPGNAAARLRGNFGSFLFIYPADSITVTATAGQTLTLNLLDPLGPSTFTVGSLTNASATPDSISAEKIRTNSTMTLVATQTIVESGSDPDADLIAANLFLSAGTGIGGPGSPIEIQTSLLEAETTTGGISLRNSGSVTIGGASGVAEINGIEVLTSGDVALDVVGSITLADISGLQTIKSGNNSGNVTLIASGTGASISSTVNEDAITAPNGSIALTAAGNIQFGVGGASFDNDVRASGGITITAGGLFRLDGNSDFASDDFGHNTGGGITISAGSGISLTDTLGTDASIVAGGTAGADVILSGGAGSLVELLFPTPDDVGSSSGDVVVNADRLHIEPDSGITASAGQIVLRPQSVGREIVLGGANEASAALEINDAELDRLFAPSLIVGGPTTGTVTVVTSISPASAPDFIIQSGSDIVVNAGVTISATSDLVLNAADGIYLVAGSNLVGGASVTGIVDADAGDPGVGGTAFAAAGFLTAVTFIGNADGDSLTGGAGNDALYGQGGDDTLNGGGAAAGGTNQLWGGTGSDTASYAGTAGIVQADLVGQVGYVGGVLKDVMNSIENLTGGTGGDTLIGDGGANLLSGGAGNDALYGQGGDDTLIGGAANAGGTNQLWGGTGIDTASYAGTAGNVQADLATQSGSIFGTLTDVMNSIENLRGGSGNDTLAGDGGANVLAGGFGADQLYGRGGVDTFAYANYTDSMLGKYDTIADFVSGVDKLSLKALATSAAHVVITSGGGSTSLYVEHTPGTLNPTIDLAISFVGNNAIAMGDILF